MAIHHIEQFRSIVKNRSFGNVGDHDKIPVDVQTANMVVSLYDSLSPPNKVKMESFDHKKMISVAQKIRAKNINEDHVGGTLNYYYFNDQYRRQSDPLVDFADHEELFGKSIADKLKILEIK